MCERAITFATGDYEIDYVDKVFSKDEGIDAWQFLLIVEMSKPAPGA